MLDNLLKAGVQNTKKGEKLEFTELKPWPGGQLIHAEGRYEEAGKTRRVGVTIGPEYGTVSYGLVREAAREALESVFDTLIVCGFAFEPKVNEEALTRFPRLTVLKARMNNDLHLADSLRSQTNNANLFVIFGEPDITIHHDEDGRVRVEILGLDISTRRPARSARPASTTSPPGLSTPITTARASLSGTPISSAATTLTSGSRRH